MKLNEKLKKGLKFIFKPWKSEWQISRFIGTILLLLVILIAVLVFNGVLHYTSTKEFCLKCHEMKFSYNYYKKSKHGSNHIGMSVECVDCHLPNDFIGYLLTKTRDGIKDVYIHTFNPIKNEEEWKARKEELDEKARGRIKNANCLKCHNNVKTGTIKGKEEHTEMDLESDKCVDCHADMFHPL